MGDYMSELIKQLEALPKKWRSEILHGFGTVEECADELDTILTAEAIEESLNRIDDRNHKTDEMQPAPAEPVGERELVRNVPPFSDIESLSELQSKCFPLKSERGATLMVVDINQAKDYAKKFTIAFIREHVRAALAQVTAERDVRRGQVIALARMAAKEDCVIGFVDDYIPESVTNVTKERLAEAERALKDLVEKADDASDYVGDGQCECSICRKRARLNQAVHNARAALRPAAGEEQAK